MKQVIPGVFRGKRPLSIMELASKKVRTHLSLQSGFFEFFHNDEFENRGADLNDSLSFKSFDLPCLPVFPPSVKNMRRALELIETSEKPFYFHCAEGVDRTGWLAALLLVKDGKTQAEAIENMKMNGFHMYRFFWWIPMFGRYCKELGLTNG